MEKPQTPEWVQVVDFIRLCFRHWYYFLCSGVVCLALAVLYVKTATPVYHVKSTVALRHDESLTGSVGKQSSGLLSAIGLGRGAENIEDETLKMASQDNVRQVIKAMDLNKVYFRTSCWGLWKEPLYEFSPVAIEVHPAVADTMLQPAQFALRIDKAGRGHLKVKYGGYRGRFVLDAFPATISIPCAEVTFSLTPEYAAAKKPMNLRILYTSYDYITQVYRSLLGIDFYKKSSDLVYLTMNSPNRDLAKRMIRATVDTYNRNWDQDKEYVYDNTIRYMNERFEENRLALADADEKIRQFKDRNELTDIEANVKFYFAQRAETQKEELEVTTRIHLMQILRKFVRNDDNRYGLVPLTLSGEDESVNAFVDKYNEAMVQRNDLRKNQPQSPLLSRLEEQLDSYRNNLMLTIDKELEGLQIVLAGIQGKDSEVARKIGALPLVEREYIQLKREQELQQTIYIFLLEKKEELGIRAVSLMPKLKVIEEPFVDNKLVSPRLFKTLLTALFFGGIVIPLGLMYGVPLVRMLRRKEQ
jgi:uncharacterized protein involved in exopolysaccharide biosynthesis